MITSKNFPDRISLMGDRISKKPINKALTCLLLNVILTSGFLTRSAVIHVPVDQLTIHSGIDAAALALGYVRRELAETGTELSYDGQEGEVVAIPLSREPM